MPPRSQVESAKVNAKRQRVHVANKKTLITQFARIADQILWFANARPPPNIPPTAWLYGPS